MQLVVALAAEDAAGVQALRLLARRGHRVVAAFTDSAPAKAGATVAGAARALEVPLRPAADVRDPALGGWLRSREIDLLLNVHSLHIMDQAVLDAPRLGAFNLHPGPLPERAGLNSPSWALYEGDPRHGVSLHRMTAVVDEGSLAFADTFPIGARDTGLTVLTRCVRRGIGLVERLLEVAEEGGTIPSTAQDPTRRRWFGPGPPERGCLDWSRPAQRIIDFVRACDYRPFDLPWGWPRCVAGEVELGIVEATAAPADGPGAFPGTVISVADDGAIVAASDGSVLVRSVEVDGRIAEATEVLRAGDALGPAGRAESATGTGR